MTAPHEDTDLAARLRALRAEVAAFDDPVHVALDRSLGAISASTPAGLRPALTALHDEAAGLGAVDRELLRRAAVEALRTLGVSDPRSLVAAALASSNGRHETTPQLAGVAIALKDVEPWPDAVDGAELVDALYGAIRRYVVLDTAGAVAAALWALHAHGHEAAQVSALLAITSPAKRCGKSTLLTVLSAVVPRPLGSANLTAAALFRAVEAYRPTLLVDEADTFLAVREELRGMLNSGHTRPFAVVVRTVGDNHEVRTFSTSAAKAVALIGTLPDTLADRSILIPMRRKTRGERVTPLRADCLYDELTQLRRQAARWARDNLDALRGADPAVPDGLSDRAADNWRPLLAIADLAGGVWAENARQAARTLSGDAQAPDQGIEALLLGDLWGLFHPRDDAGVALKPVDRLPTAAVLEHLVAMQERPWPEWSHGRPMSPRGLARILGRFGIEPVRWRDGADNPRGYSRDQFADAWSRYLAPCGTSGTSGTAKCSNDLHVPDVPDVPDTPGGGA